MTNKTLCFDEEVFHEKNFSVDEFLAKYKNVADWETLRDDLRTFLTSLQLSTSQLINKDYADFVALSANLVSVEKNIVDTETPTIKIKDEVLKTKTSLDEAITKISDLLERRKSARKKMQGIKSAVKVQNSISKFSELIGNISEDSNERTQLSILERSLSEIHVYHYHSKQSQIYLNDSFINLYKTTLEQFLFNLKNIFLSSVKKDEKLVLTCLNLYTSVDKVDLIYDIVRDSIVSPVMSTLINEDALQNEPGGLTKFFSNILNGIDSELKILLDITQNPNSTNYLKGFDFMNYSVWPELVSRLKGDLKSIYNTGNSDYYLECYNATFNFIDEFEKRCITRQSVINIRNTDSYIDLLRCWNLSVYFSMRSPQIISNLESINECTVADKNSEWKLSVSEKVWKNMMRCWDKYVFVRQLAHEFWKCNLQNIAHYQIWIHKLLCTKTTLKSKSDLLICAYHDGNLLIDKFNLVLDTALNSIADALPDDIVHNMKECLQESESNLRTVLDNIETNVVNSVSEKIVPDIEQISHIPRLYRNTNRENPTSPSAYVSALFAPISEIEKMNSPYMSKMIFPIISTITREYRKQVSSVLLTAQKIEESLRKCNPIRDPVRSDCSDDEKMKMQFRIDIQNYIEKATSLCGISKRIDELEELNIIATSLETKS